MSADRKDGAKVGAETLPIAIAAWAVFLDIVLADAVVPVGGVILGMTPLTVGLAVWGLRVDATTAVGAGAVALARLTDGRRISLLGTFMEI